MDDDSAYEFDTAVACPCCGGVGDLLGVLGNLKHFRCTCCGVDFTLRIQ